MRLSLLMALLPALAWADQSVPAPTARPAQCTAPHQAVVRELERLLKSAAEHASHSDVCADGDGERVDLKLLEACRLPQEIDEMLVVRVWIRYRATTVYEVGGECTPYPKCAEPPPPSTSSHSATLDFGNFPPGLRISLPSALPGVTFKTPLGKKHSSGCHGDKPAFAPKYVVLK